MIGFISGEVIFSDGHEVIMITPSGVGYQCYYSKVLPEGKSASLFISHIVRENAEDLYAFRNLREKKMFEILLTVKGVGPKSAFSLVGSLGVNEVHDAILYDNKKLLTQAPGIGGKSAAQIILDLQNKVHKIKMYSMKEISIMKAISNSESKVETKVHLSSELISNDNNDNKSDTNASDQYTILNETIMACKELGFKEEKIVPLAQKILSLNEIKRAEQLVHLVLKEI